MIMMTCFVAATGDDDVRGLVLVKKRRDVYEERRR